MGVRLAPSDLAGRFGLRRIGTQPSVVPVGDIGTTPWSIGSSAWFQVRATAQRLHRSASRLGKSAA